MFNHCSHCGRTLDSLKLTRDDNGHEIVDEQCPNPDCPNNPAHNLA